MTKKKPTKSMKLINGNNILYHFLQKDLFNSDIWLFQMLSARLVASLGIWFHPQVYQRMPILLPFAVRDLTCRRRKEGDIEAWGAPDEDGYLRDDNSLVKALPKSLNVISPRQALYSGKRIGTGFVASHVWRQIDGSSVGAQLASRDPVLNTFVPNLVWLPAQVSKLTDREGTFTQLYLQALSAKIYKHLTVPPAISPIVDRAWDMVAVPSGIPEQGLPNTEELSYFEPTTDFYAKRHKKIQDVADAFQQLADSGTIAGKVVTTRYGDGLPSLSEEVVHARLQEFQNYLLAIESIKRENR